jgi:tellurite resistance protein TehA-like permease
MGPRLEKVVAELPPAYFAMVMATGIVSIASHHMGLSFVSVPLVWLNTACYVLLWGLTLARLALKPRRFIGDLNQHLSGVGFFTMVAGTCVLGSQFVILLQSQGWGLILLGVGVTLWGIFLYGVFAALTIKEAKPSLEAGISGVWLVAVVSTQSVSVLSGLLASQMAHRVLVLFFSYCMFLVGGMLYILIITLIFYRFLFFPLEPDALTPPYWINMGAVAISTLAGANLILLGQGVEFLDRMIPFTLGLTVFFWAAATWWIPLILLLGAWRYLVRRVGFSYDPQYWGMVFPLGMYTVCTFKLAQAVQLDFLFEIPRYSIFAALLAWTLTFAGFVRSMIRALSAPADARPMS